ncbi:hypothetical protein JOM56_014246, partial [Amanita muscaria]
NWSGEGSVRRYCFDSFIWGNLSHTHMAPSFGIYTHEHPVMVSQEHKNDFLREWQLRTKPSVSKIQRIGFEVATALQYVHSLGIIFRSDYFLGLDSFVDLDSDNHVQVAFVGSSPNGLCKGETDYTNSRKVFTLEDNINLFGDFFYWVLFNKSDGEVTSEMRPKEPEIPDNVWQLIQWCCAKDPKGRPTMDQVVQEIESWTSVGQFTLSS